MPDNLIVNQSLQLSYDEAIVDTPKVFNIRQIPPLTARCVTRVRPITPIDQAVWRLLHERLDDKSEVVVPGTLAFGHAIYARHLDVNPRQAREFD